MFTAKIATALLTVLTVVPNAERSIEMPLPTPRTAAEVIGLSPDYARPADLALMGVTKVAINFPRQNYTNELCRSGKVRVNKSTFCPDRRNTWYLKKLQQQSIETIAIVYGTPENERRNICRESAFCEPKNNENAVNFAEYIADENPEIIYFVIGNEVNSSAWFNIGCIDTCDFEAWVDQYTDLLIDSYKAIKKHNPAAKILIPLTHHIGQEFDRRSRSTPQLDPGSPEPLISVLTFIDKLVKRGVFELPDIFLDPHIYNKDLTSTECTTNDYPTLTSCNIDQIAEILKKRYQQYPQLWNLYSTEQGISSAKVSEAEHAERVCTMFKQVLGSQAMKLFVWHRLFDHPTETAASANFGLISNPPDRRPKAALGVFESTLKNKTCGAENYPIVTNAQSEQWSR